MAEEYIYFSDEDALKLIPKYSEMIGSGYVEARSGKTFEVIAILQMPANPVKRDKVWDMMLDRYNGGETTIDEIEKYMKSLEETEFTVSMLSKEHLPIPHPPFRIDHLQYVIDENGDVAMGFGIAIQ